jgi:hypothetical protein
MSQNQTTNQRPQKFATEPKPALIRVDISDVSQQNCVWHLAVKFLFQQIRGRLQLMITIGSDRLSTPAQKRRNLVFLHYSGHTPLRDKLTIHQQVLMNTLGTVTLLTGFEEDLDFGEQLLVSGLPVSLKLTSSRLTGPKIIEPTPRYLKQPT